MLTSIRRAEGFKPEVRGLHAIYRSGEVNHCPGCGRTNWIIGRITAECAFCGTALGLEQNVISSNDRVVGRFRKEPNKKCF